MQEEGMLADGRVDVLSDGALGILLASGSSVPIQLLLLPLPRPDQCNAPNPSLGIVPRILARIQRARSKGAFGATFGGIFTGAHLEFLLLWRAL